MGEGGYLVLGVGYWVLLVSQVWGLVDGHRLTLGKNIAI